MNALTVDFGVLTWFITKLSTVDHRFDTINDEQITHLRNVFQIVNWLIFLVEFVSCLFGVNMKCAKCYVDVFKLRNCPVR